LEWSLISVTSLMMWSTHLGLVKRMLVLCSWMWCLTLTLLHHGRIVWCSSQICRSTLATLYHSNGTGQCILRPDFQWSTCHYIPEDGTFHNHMCENHIYYIIWYFNIQFSCLIKCKLILCIKICCEGT
jgi:hypothetical protein